MRRAIVFLVLLGLTTSSARASRARKVRDAYDACLRGAAARQGVQHRSLVMVALVRGAPGTASPVPVDPSAVVWEPEDGKKSDTTAKLTRKADDGGGAVLLPSGLVLRAGTHERLLRRPVLLAPGTPFTARTTTLASSEPPASVRVVEGLPPPEFRHTLFLLEDRAALGDLLHLEAAALGGNPMATPPTLASLTADAAVRTRVQACAGALAALGTAYGGETVGHVAFLGEGVVQFVFASSPATYRSYLRSEASGLGLALMVWESLYGDPQAPVAGARWDEILAATSRLLEHLRAASFKLERRKEEGGGELWRVRATAATRRGRPPDVGWVLLDDAGRPLLVEAWPDNAPLPPPTGTPASSRHGDAADDGGAITWYFVKRFYDRFPWRHEPEWARRVPRPPGRDEAR